MLEKFIAYLEEQAANHSIYIWGAQGQGFPTVNEAWIKEKESGTHEKNALKVYRAAVAAGYEKKLRAFDCSGLGMYWLIKEGICKSDMNANGMKGKCTLIDKSEVKKGCWVFRCYNTGAKRAYHIGYVVDDALNVIEAQGRAYGVVKRPLAKGGWNAYGIPSYFKKDIAAAKFVGFSRNLKKGMKGADVAELQKLINKAGDNIAADGSYGTKTAAAVKAFQKARGLAADGIAGEATINALGGKWKGATVTTWAVIRNLKKGCEGKDVKALQTALIKAGYACGSTGADGDFGANTENAVKAFQKARGLAADGIAGKATISALGGAWGA